MTDVEALAREYNRPRSLASRVGAIEKAIVQLDRILLRSQEAHRLASTTFVLARKPSSEKKGLSES